jgi:hypothetical protein
MVKKYIPKTDKFPEKYSVRQPLAVGGCVWTLPFPWNNTDY